MANQPRRGLSKLRTAKTHEEWLRLMRSAIELAEKSNDPRVHGLRSAHAQGMSEQHLRRLGIVCPTDLQREFPQKS